MRVPGPVVLVRVVASPIASTCEDGYCGAPSLFQLEARVVDEELGEPRYSSFSLCAAHASWVFVAMLGKFERGSLGAAAP